MSDYLWDKSGDPHPEVERLEKLLGRYRHNQPLPPSLRGRPVRLPFPFQQRALAIAAACLMMLSATWLATRGPRQQWSVARVDGAPRVGEKRLAGDGSWGVGEWLETDSESRAKIKVSIIGEVDVEPNSRLQLVKTRLTEHRIALERGAIGAMIWAPARTFFVNTPSAVAVDLGCKYTLTVDESGAGLVRVILGWVGFESNGHESFVPEGALCATRPGRLGTPYYEDASGGLRDALRRVDFENGGSEALAIVLREARKRDAVTLWHLLVRVPPDQVAAVYDRLAALVPPPGGVTSGGVLRRDKRMHELWWDALGLENTAWWRKWIQRGLP